MPGPSSISSFSSSMPDLPLLTDDRYHVDFSSSEGDIVLVSSDQVKFCTHTFLLKVASGVFRSTHSLPQLAGVLRDEHGLELRLPEDARTIDAILRLISGMEIPALSTFDDIEKVLLTAKKWDMPGPPSIIHRMITPQALLDDPVRLYALACRVGWSDAAAVAAKHTLDVDLQHEDVQPILHSIDSRDLLKLLNMRTRRRDALLDFLLSFTVPGCLSHLPQSARQNPTEHELSVQWQWKAFMFTAFIAMDRHPSGQTLLGPQSVLQSDLEDMRSIKCPHFEGTPAFDVDGLEKELRTKLTELSRAI
ncbi:hypothetical protein JB92DRAFT_3125243 [Gautieria morchelliformis]|nr:hypothetical protein JB92DRAFT_3125243 [Gautieria morchelliformis]